MLCNGVGQGGRVNSVPLLREGGSREGKHHQGTDEHHTKRSHRNLQSSSTDENVNDAKQG
jgi:hypothetical protein